MKVSVYVPCFNRGAALPCVLRAIFAQSCPPDEVIVVDDGSHDDSVAVARAEGARVLEMRVNRGRGAARALAMQAVSNELVVSCDATTVLGPDFSREAQRWFESPLLAAVYGPVCQETARTAVERWRGRHLFRTGQAAGVTHGASLITGAAVVRRSIVMAAGNYNASLRDGEDRDLGGRLLAAGYDVVCVPELAAESIGKNSVGQVLERYARWNRADRGLRLPDYFRLVGYSVRVMLARDLRAGDPLSGLISLLAPHYQLWDSWRSRSHSAAQPRTKAPERC